MPFLFQQNQRILQLEERVCHLERINQKRTTDSYDPSKRRDQREARRKLLLQSIPAQIPRVTLEVLASFPEPRKPWYRRLWQSAVRFVSANLISTSQVSVSTPVRPQPAPNAPAERPLPSRELSHSPEPVDGQRWPPAGG